MDNAHPLRSVEPRPISTSGNMSQQPYQQPMPGTMPGTMPQFMPDSLPQHPTPYDMNAPQPYPPPPGMGLHQGPEAHVPAPPGSTFEIPRPPTQTFTGVQQSTSIASSTSPPKDLRNVRANCLFQMKEYMTLQNKSKRTDLSTSTLDLQNQLRNQAGIAVLELKRLQGDLREVAKRGEEHRWRKWLVGGAIASFVPLVRRIFRRNDDEESQVSANDTEYAWRRATNLLARIRDSILGKGSLASIAFFVFAVLYVFQNEVKLRVARTLRKRVRKLCARIEAGDETVGDEDLKVFDGWRWRIVL
ncbi:hypothetical protein NLU13_6825 [Sarocladium strictum]|uniref:Uncharacterized protein n=1 Tax=Sarocladium strictum TaxID=5046 RepID=A0AA39GFB3_SARSR|nr:hypothetical protein NLU13_6825 [Sarocladium strictum]